MGASVECGNIQLPPHNHIPPNAREARGSFRRSDHTSNLSKLCWQKSNFCKCHSSRMPQLDTFNSYVAIKRHFYFKCKLIRNSFTMMLKTEIHPLSKTLNTNTFCAGSQFDRQDKSFIFAQSSLARAAWRTPYWW